jgi:hypothetical protein
VTQVILAQGAAFLWLIALFGIGIASIGLLIESRVWFLAFSGLVALAVLAFMGCVLGYMFQMVTSSVTRWGG